MLRNRSRYYHKEAGPLFGIAQGLVHFGNGLLTLASFHRFWSSMTLFDRKDSRNKGSPVSGVITLFLCLERIPESLSLRDPTAPQYDLMFSSIKPWSRQKDGKDHLHPLA